MLTLCAADTGLAECTQLSNLRHLALKPHPNLADNNMLVVSRLTQLRSLTLCLPSYNKQQLEGIKQLTALKVRISKPSVVCSSAVCDQPAGSLHQYA